MATEKLRAEWQQEKQLRNEKAPNTFAAPSPSIDSPFTLRPRPEPMPSPPPPPPTRTLSFPVTLTLCSLSYPVCNSDTPTGTRALTRRRSGRASSPRASRSPAESSTGSPERPRTPPHLPLPSLPLPRLPLLSLLRLPLLLMSRHYRPARPRLLVPPALPPTPRSNPDSPGY